MTITVTVRKLTGLDELRAACDATRHPGQTPSSATLERMYRCEHSPIRSQLFWLRLENLPTFVSVHLVRHKIGVEHFVESNRDDRGGAGDSVVTRETPVTHSMLINAEALLGMARKRLCHASHRETRAVMHRIRRALQDVDPDLEKLLVPQCVVRGYCPELKPCHPGPAAVIRAHSDSWYCQERARLAAGVGT